MAAFKVEIRDHFRGIFFSSSFLHTPLNLNKLNIQATLNHFLNSYFDFRSSTCTALERVGQCSKAPTPDLLFIN